MLKEARVVIIFDEVRPVMKAERTSNLHLVIGLVLAVAAAPLGLPILHRSDVILTRKLFDIIGDAVFIAKLICFKTPRGFIAQRKKQPLVYHGLPL